MDKLEKFMEEYDDRFVNYETGECLDVNKFIEIYEHCREHKTRVKRSENLKKLKAIKGFKIKENGGGWMMIYTLDITDKKLTMEEKGVYYSLIEKLILDGSCRVYSLNSSFKSYGEEFKISKNRIKSVFESLMSKELIYFENIKEILINPKYYRYGNHIKNQKAIEVFKIDIE